jgi:hypothetical protein
MPISSTGVDDNPWFISTSALQIFADQWFFAGPMGGVVFRTPVWGVTTSGSTHPRTELRETNSIGDQVNWITSSFRVSSLSVAMEVNQVPNVTLAGTLTAIIIGQIKGSGLSGSTSSALAMMQYRYFPSTQTGQVVVQVTLNPAVSTATTYTFPSATNIGLNQSFSYEMTVTSDPVTGVPSLAVTVNGDTLYPPIFAAWSAHTVYFKAGNYLRDNSAEATGFGQVTIYGLNLTHT